MLRDESTQDNEDESRAQDESYDAKDHEHRGQDQDYGYDHYDSQQRSRLNAAAETEHIRSGCAVKITLHTRTAADAFYTNRTIHARARGRGRIRHGCRA